MTPRLLVTGTGTDIGKTVFSAALAGALGAAYWKPVQTGAQADSDSVTVARLAGCRIWPEAHRLAAPLSPDQAAAREDMAIDPSALRLPDGPLVVEGAGGPMVPLDGSTLFLDVFARWRLPAVVCATTSLGTINHTLLTLHALRSRAVPVLGVALIGEENEANQQSILRFAGCPVLGRLPWLRPLTREILRAAFARHFRLADFQA